MSYRTTGSFYAILGVVVFVAGLATLFDPTANRIYVGAIIFGPVIAYRGIALVRLAHENPGIDATTTRVASGMKSSELYAGNLQRGDPPNEVSCEECSEEYIYFPGTAAHAQALKYGDDAAFAAADLAFQRNCACAPCPRCGRIQADMFAMVQENGPPVGVVLMWVGLFVSFGSALFLCYVISQATAEPWNRSPGAPPVLALWLANSGLILLGVSACLASLWLKRRWNPNSLPLEKRFKLARKVSLPREHYLKLSATATSETHEAERR
jgi:hypothetical protein